MHSGRCFGLGRRIPLLVAVLLLFLLVTPAAATAVSVGADESLQTAPQAAAAQSPDPEPEASNGLGSAEAPPTPDEDSEPAADEPSAEEPAVQDPSSDTGHSDDVTESAVGADEPASDALSGSTEDKVVTSDSIPAGAAVGTSLLGEPKVTICHATRDRTNPYDQITVTIPQANGHAAVHNGPIFAPARQARWGDIIPPIPGLSGGQNWPAGRGILANGCEVQPDPGPLPGAAIGELECDGPVPSLDITVSNDADATAPATFTIFVDGDLVQAVGPIAPGADQTVTLTGPALVAGEDQTFTVDVRSGGVVVASEVVSVDCTPPPTAGVEISAGLSCGDSGAEGSLTVTNNGPDPVTVTVAVNGEPGQPLVVAPGATDTASRDLSQFEDQTVTVQVLVDGEVVATYTPKPDCEQVSAPGVDIPGLECRPPTTTVTLFNSGDPESTVAFTLLINGTVVQQSAPLFGGDVTTIVGNLARFRSQTVTVEVRAGDEVLGSRSIAVDCARPSSPGPNTAPANGAGSAGSQGAGAAPLDSSQVLPATGAGFSSGIAAGGLVLLALGLLLMFVANRPRGRGHSAR